MSEHDDDQLRVEAAQQDPARFDQLYERNFHRVYAYVIRRVGDRHQAEDLAAEVFHELLQHRWFLSERRGRDVGLQAAARSYVEDVLRHVPDERTLLEG